jgi:hypothetical protein
MITSGSRVSWMTSLRYPGMFRPAVRAALDHGSSRARISARPTTRRGSGGARERQLEDAVLGEEVAKGDVVRANALVRAILIPRKCTAGELLAFETTMPTMRDIGLTALAISWIVVLVSPRRRRVIARKLAGARRFASGRIVDADARASSQAVDAWEGEGGATRGSNDTDRSSDGANRASPVIDLPRR